jgi:hypothetical protein
MGSNGAKQRIDTFFDGIILVKIVKDENFYDELEYNLSIFSPCYVHGGYSL